MSFKTLSVNNFFARHSPGANCEQDDSHGALDTLRCFVTGEEIAGITSFHSSTSTVDLPHLPLHHRKSRVGKATLAYIAGFIGNSLLKKYGNCNMCREVLLTSDGTAVPVEVIEARTYSASHLTKPGSFLYWAISLATSRLHYAIGRICCKPNLPALLKNILTHSRTRLHLQTTEKATDGTRLQLQTTFNANYSGRRKLHACLWSLDLCVHREPTIFCDISRWDLFSFCE
jgi:hypothetical protein